MKIKLQYIIPVFLLFCSCNTGNDKTSFETWKQEILKAEQDFAALAKEEGINKAFITYAAEDAVLMRGNTLVIGKKDLIVFFKNQPPLAEDASLTWKPDFIDVAASGDLAYTYGQFTFSYSDSSGVKKENTGVFHTVWKRQDDGAWKFVWD